MIATPAPHCQLALLIVGVCLGLGVAKIPTDGCVPRPADLLPLPEAVQLRDVNLVYTTDIHAWVSSHAHPDNAPALDATLGDVLDFTAGLKAAAAAQGRDLFIFDNGDQVDGAAVSNMIPDKVELLAPLFAQMPYDAVNCGNHELYENATVRALRDSGYIASWNGSYLTTNVFLAAEGEGEGVRKPQQRLGSHHVTLKGPHGASLLVFGFMYNMADHCGAVHVQRVEQAVAAPEFEKAVQGTDADAIVVLSHMDIRDPLALTILDAVRRLRPGSHASAGPAGGDMPVVFLTGHSHYDAFVRMDGSAAAVEAGCNLDRVGFISFDVPQWHFIGGRPSSGGFVNFSAAAVPANKASLAAALAGHTGALLPSTTRGESLRRASQQTRTDIGAEVVLGQNERRRSVTVPLEDKSSFWAWYMSEVVPSMLFERPQHQWLVTSTGAARYDLWPGSVTVDDTYTTLPFVDTFHSVPGIRGDMLTDLLRRLNNATSSTRAPQVGAALGVPAAAVAQTGFPRYVSTGTPTASASYEVIITRFDVFDVEALLADITGDVIVTTPYRPELNTTTLLQNYFSASTFQLFA